MNRLSVMPSPGIDTPTTLGNPTDALLRSLHAHDISCWLDSGTLLGVCRDGRPPDWDKDIDLAMWITDLEPARALLENFSRNWGYKMQEKWLDGRPYAIVLKLGMALKQRPDGVFVRIKELPINIHLFSKDEHWAASAQPHYLLANSTAYARFRLGKLPDRQTAVPPLPWSKRVQYTLVHLAGRFNLNIFFRPVLRRLEEPDPNNKVLIHPSERRGCKWLFEKFVWKVPLKYFAALERPPGFPEFVKIPEEYDAYLTHRYGQWRKPARDWLYMIDDGLLQPGEKKVRGKYGKQSPH